MYNLISEVNEILLKKRDMDDLKYINKEYKKSTDLVDKIQLDYFKIIPAPPKNSSNKTLLELEELSRITHDISPKDIRLIYMVDRDPLDLFSQAINFNMPVNIFKEIYWGYLDKIISDLKHFYNRPRPAQLAKILNIDLHVRETKTHDTPAYPSGHSAYAYLAAYIFSEHYPEHKRKFFDIADLCGYARMLQGVHYRSDIEASKQLVSKIYKSLKKINNQDKLNLILANKEK